VGVPEISEVMRSLVRMESAADALSVELATIPVGYTPAGLRADPGMARAVRTAAFIILRAYPLALADALPGLQHLANQSLDRAELPTRIRTALAGNGIRDWGALADHGLQDLLNIRMLGRGSVRVITEAAAWRIAALAVGKVTGSFMVADSGRPRSALLPPGSVAIPLHALAAWAIAERGITTVGELLALVPDARSLPAEIASEWEQARELDLRQLAGGPSTLPYLPGLLRELLADLEERRREILTRRTFAHHPQTLDALTGEFGVSRERVRQLESSALVQIGVAVTADKYAPLRWQAHIVASTSAGPGPGLLEATGHWPLAPGPGPCCAGSHHGHREPPPQRPEGLAAESSAAWDQ
jgi:hypothetical protein